MIMSLTMLSKSTFVILIEMVWRSRQERRAAGSASQPYH
jgi:hypothetical protein